MSTIGTAGSQIYGISVLPDGKVFAAGIGAMSTSDMTIARYTEAGILDTSWGGTGVVFTDVAGDAQAAFGMLVQSDGKPIAIGYSLVGGSNYDVMAARYHTDGSLDTTYGTGGIASVSAGGTQLPRGGAFDPDGNLVITGSAAGVGIDFLIARLTTAGALDAGFGMSTTNFGGTDVSLAVISYPDGRALQVGVGNNNFGLARFLTNGSLDTTFGTGGTVSHDVAGLLFPETAAAVALYSNGKILVGGHGLEVNSGTMAFVLTRYHSDGSVDSSFNGNGVSYSPYPGAITDAAAMAFQSDGKILLAGTIGSDFGITRFLPEGVVDSAFGTDGFVRSDFAGAYDTGWSLSVQSDGKIILGGACTSGGVARFCMARFNP